MTSGREYIWKKRIWTRKKERDKKNNLYFTDIQKKIILNEKKMVRNITNRKPI